MLLLSVIILILPLSVLIAACVFWRKPWANSLAIGASIALGVILLILSICGGVLW